MGECPIYKGEDSLLVIVARQDLPEKVEQDIQARTSERWGSTPYADILGKRDPGWGKSKCKVPESGACLSHCQEAVRPELCVRICLRKERNMKWDQQDKKPAGCTSLHKDFNGFLNNVGPCVFCSTSTYLSDCLLPQEPQPQHSTESHQNMSIWRVHLCHVIHDFTIWNTFITFVDHQTGSVVYINHFCSPSFLK